MHSNRLSPDLSIDTTVSEYYASEKGTLVTYEWQEYGEQDGEMAWLFLFGAPLALAVWIALRMIIKSSSAPKRIGKDLRA